MAKFVSVIISGNASPLKKALDKATANMSTFQKQVTLGFIAAGAAATAFAASAVKAAAKDQEAKKNLIRQIKASTGATEESLKGLGDYISAMRRASAVGGSELRPALASLVTGTHDLGKAQELLSISLDVARARGMDVTAVADALAKGYAGNTRSLRTLSPEIKKAIADGASFADVLDILRKNFGGAAAEYTKTFAGRMENLKLSVGAIKKKIGEELLPVLEKMVPRLQAAANWIEKNHGIISAAATVIGILSVAFIGANVALLAWKANAAITAGVNFVLATSFTAVQVATGIGIATAIAGVAVYLKLKDAYKNTAGAVDDLTEAVKRNKDGTYGAVSVGQYQIELQARLAAEAEKSAKANEKAKQRFEALKDTIENAKRSIRDYVASIQSAISGTVSLSNAFSRATTEQEEATANLTKALEDRRTAYEALSQARATNDAIAYGRALQDVTDAEKAVTDAQGAKPRNYTAIFREQIQAAKTFAGSLQKLIASPYKLSKAGVQQLLDLGPVAGAQVANDLLSGAAGLSVGEINQSLAAVAAAGTAAGMATPGVRGALTATPGSGGAFYQITVNAGVGDKTQIAKEIVGVLQDYEKRLGRIPVRTIS